MFVLQLFASGWFVRSIVFQDNANVKFLFVEMLVVQTCNAARKGLALQCVERCGARSGVCLKDMFVHVPSGFGLPMHWHTVYGSRSFCLKCQCSLLWFSPWAYEA